MSLTIMPMTDEMLKEMVDEHNMLNPDREIRADIKASLDDYAINGKKPGGFLTAVLENDLMNAFGRADSYNRATLCQICQYIYNELPNTCHGSPEIVSEYLKSFRGES